MQSADLQASLGFLQAIHLGAKNAKVNKEVCQSLSTVVGRLRPCLEEVDMVESNHEQQSNQSLEMIETALEKILVTIGRFSTMGYLQSVLEAQACCDNFSQCRDSMLDSLKNLMKSSRQRSTQRWVEDVRRICARLEELRFDDLHHLQLAKAVHATSRGILDAVIPEQNGQENIRKQLVSNLSVSPEAIRSEIQGLERELSRARVEKKVSEVEELQMIICSLKQSSSDAENERKPRPPVEYLCPISRGIMKDPVVLVETGQTYDRRYIEEWFGRGNKTCPATKLQVNDLSLTPNYALKSLASSWITVNSGDGDWVDDDSSIVFQRSISDTDSCSSKKIELDLKTAKCGNGRKVFDGCCPTTTIQCEYTRMDMHTTVEKVLPSSVDLQSVVPKDSETCSEIGSRTSSAGKARTASTCSTSSSTKDQKTKWKHFQTIEKMPVNMQKLSLKNSQTVSGAELVKTKTGTASSSDSSSVKRGAPMAENKKNQHNGLKSVGGYAQQLIDALQANPIHAKNRNKLDVYSTCSGMSAFCKQTRRTSGDNMRVQDAIHALKLARSMPKVLDSEEFATRSTQSARMRVIARNKSNQSSFTVAGQGRQLGKAPASICSGISQKTKKSQEAENEQVFGLYKDLEAAENESDDGSEHHSTDIAEEDFIDAVDIETSSLSTIQSRASKYAASVMSIRPTMKKGNNLISIHSMQGATNVIFDEDEDYEDGAASVNEQEDTNDVSLPVLAGLLQKDDPQLLASSANDLAIKAQTDESILYDIPRTDIIPSLVKLLDMPSDAVKAASARALGVIGDRNPEARVQILNAGAVSRLSALFKKANEKQTEQVEGGSIEDIAGAMRFALDALSANKRNAPSVDVSTSMLVECLTTSCEDDMQASAILELQEKMNSVYGEVVLKELAESDILLNLVDALTHKDEYVQLGASDILSRLIFHDQKTQRELSQSVGIVSKLLRLVKQGTKENTSCRSAAAHVLRGLAHNNSKIREDVLRRGSISDFASLLCSSDSNARENAAWMLGILASHSKNGKKAVMACEQAVFMLDELAADGSVQEKVASKFALRSIDSEVAGDEDCELSGAIVINSLLKGTPEVKVVAAWELCRMASSNQWSQLEIYENDGVSALMAYLKARPKADGIQACLATLLKLAGCEAKVAAQIAREEGVIIAVNLLKSHTAMIDKKLVIQLLTVLAEKCPLHQQEMVSHGALPVLVELLLTDEAASLTSCRALECLLDNEMAATSVAVADMATPIALDFLRNPESPTFGKRSAIRLLAKIGQASYDCHQCIVRYKVMEVLMDMLQKEEEPEIVLALTRASSSLSNKAPTEQRRPQTRRLVETLQQATKQKTTNAPGLVQISDYSLARSGTLGAASVSNRSDFFGTTSSHTELQSSRQLSRRASFAPSKQSLPVVPEIPISVGGGTDQDAASDTMIEAQESPFAPSHDRVPMWKSLESAQNQSPVRTMSIGTTSDILDTPKALAGDCFAKLDNKFDGVAVSLAPSSRRAPSVVGGLEEETRKSVVSSKGRTSPQRVPEEMNRVVQGVHQEEDQLKKKESLQEMRRLVTTKPGFCSSLLQHGVIEKMVGNLALKTSR